MGQKINPVGFRLAVNRNWSSRWYANSKSFAPMLAEDIKVRDFLKRKLAHASVGRVLIERPADRGMRELLFQEVAHCDVLGEHRREGAAVGVPARAPVAVDREAEPDRIDLLTHQSPTVM